MNERARWREYIPKWREARAEAMADATDVTGKAPVYSLEIRGLSKGARIEVSRVRDTAIGSETSKQLAVMAALTGATELNFLVAASMRKLRGFDTDDPTELLQFGDPDLIRELTDIISELTNGGAAGNS